MNIEIVSRRSASAKVSLEAQTPHLILTGTSVSIWSGAVKMSSPKRRIETDVMKLMMSDYEVTLVNDSMQEFYVIFKGPAESKKLYSCGVEAYANIAISALRRWTLEDSRGTTRPIPLQISINRVREPHISPKHRRAVRGVAGNKQY